MLFAANKSIGTISDWKKLPKGGGVHNLYSVPENIRTANQGL
jgi:hypothetical protein